MSPIILINPPLNPCVAQSLPVQDLSLGYLLAVLRNKNYPVVLLDANMERLTTEELVQQTIQHKHTAIVIPLMYRTLTTSVEIISKLRKLTNQPLLGYRYAATLSAYELLNNEPGLDGVILGEPEDTLLDLATKWDREEDWHNTPGLLVKLENDVQLTPPRRLIEDLDELPFPSRDYMVESLSNRPVAEILSSRGCYKSCTFCNTHVLYSYNHGAHWRARSPKNVVDELEHLYTYYGVNHFEFVDENFIGPGINGRERVASIASEILSRNLKIDFRIFCRVDHVDKVLFSHLREAGLCTVNLGVESGNDRILRRLNKEITTTEIERAIVVLNNLGIVVFPSFIMFEPTMNLDELEVNLRFVEQNQLWNCVNPTIIIPFKGTGFYHQLKEEDLLASDRFIVEPYIPQVRYKTSGVEKTLQEWTKWQQLCDMRYNGLLSKLNSAYYIFLEQTFQECEGSTWLKLRDFSIQLKKLELSYVRAVAGLAEGSPKAPVESDFEDTLSNLHRQVEQILLSSPQISHRLLSI